jgi:hypothetical protein
VVPAVSIGRRWAASLIARSVSQEQHEHAFRRQIGARIRTPHRTCVCGFVRTQALIAPRALVTIPIRQVRMGAGLVPLHVKKHRTDQ